MNRTALIVVISIAAAILVGSIGGCDLGDAITVQTPPGVQQTSGLPAKMSLNDANAEYGLWLAGVRSDGQRWRDNIDRSNQIRVLIEQFTLKQLEEYGPTLSGIPVLGPALPLLTGLGGLLIKRPGDKTKDQAQGEKDSAWDEAFQAGKAAALEAIREVKA